jgi:hypothetical protein
MKFLRFIFGALILELCLIAIIGYLAVDNSPCDIMTSWHWSYVTKNDTNFTNLNCPTFTNVKETTQLRFISLELALIALPVTIVIGYGYSLTHDDRKRDGTKNNNDSAAKDNQLSD